MARRPPSSRVGDGLAHGARGVHGARRRTVVGAVAAIAAAAAAVAAIIASDASGTGNGDRRPLTASGAVTVQRRDLVATDTETGTLGYADPQTVYNRLSGTITSLPSVGQVFQPGQTLYEVDNTPVVLFEGSTPAWRDLASGVSDGPDVYELNRNLADLGFDPYRQLALNDVWQPATSDAVQRWQASLGRPQTGTIPLGQIVFLPGAQRITAVDTVLGSTGQAASGGSPGSSTTSAPLTPRSAFVDFSPAAPGPAGPTGASGPTGPSGPATSPASRAPDGAQTPTAAPKAGAANDSPAILSALEALLKAEAAQPKSNAPSASHSPGSATPPASSSGGAPAQAILQTASPRLVVSVALDATMQSEATVGAAVTVQLPDGSTVGGRVTHVSPVAQSSSTSPGSSGSGNGNGNGASGSPPAATIPVTVALSGQAATTSGLDQATVSVSFEQQKATNVLSVPVTALLATAGGGYALQAAAAPHRLIAVSPGLFAAGYVQISGAGLYDGLQVTDSQG